MIDWFLNVHCQKNNRMNVFLHDDQVVDFTGIQALICEENMVGGDPDPIPTFTLNVVYSYYL